MPEAGGQYPCQQHLCQHHPCQQLLPLPCCGQEPGCGRTATGGCSQAELKTFCSVAVNSRGSLRTEIRPEPAFPAAPLPPPQVPAALGMLWGSLLRGCPAPHRALLPSLQEEGGSAPGWRLCYKSWVVSQGARNGPGDFRAPARSLTGGTAEGCS